MTRPSQPLSSRVPARNARAGVQPAKAGRWLGSTTAGPRWAASSEAPRSQPGVSRRRLALSHGAEALFYFSVVVRVFQQATRLSDYPQLGPLIALFASLAAVAMVGRYGGFRVPSLWFTVGLLLTANLSQVIGHGATVLVGQGLPPFLFLMLDLAAACPIAMHDASTRSAENAV